MRLLLLLLLADDPTGIHLIPPAPEQVKDCGKAGIVCAWPAAKTTARTGVAATATGRVTTLTRVAPTASAQGAERAGRNQPWDATLIAPLRRKSVTGTILVVAFDRGDPNAIAEHEVTAIWDLTAQATKLLGLRLHFDPEAGFFPGHTYLIRVAQVLNSKEVILAEGDVKLE